MIQKLWTWKVWRRTKKGITSSALFWITSPFSFKFTLKIDRSNNEAVTSKFIPKAIMEIFRWKNNFNNEKNFENWSEYKSQRSYCINLPKQSKPDPLFNLAFQDSFIFNRELWVLLFFLKRLRYTENLYSI